MGELAPSQRKNMDLTPIFASCDFCFVNFMDENQYEQHVMYHKSAEFINLWLMCVKRYQPSNPDAKYEPIEIIKPSEYYKYRPTARNSVPKTPRVSDWDLSWEEWDALGMFFHVFFKQVTDWSLKNPFFSFMGRFSWKEI